MLPLGQDSPSVHPILQHGVSHALMVAQKAAVQWREDLEALHRSFPGLTPNIDQEIFLDVIKKSFCEASQAQPLA